MSATQEGEAKFVPDPEMEKRWLFLRKLARGELPVTGGKGLEYGDTKANPELYKSDIPPAVLVETPSQPGVSETRVSSGTETARVDSVQQAADQAVSQSPEQLNLPILPEGLTPRQSFFLGRLSRLQQMRGSLTPGDWRMNLLNKAMNSTFQDCVQDGVVSQAKNVVNNQGQRS